MIRAIFDNAACWVLAKHEAQALPCAQNREQLAQAFSVLEKLAQSCQAPVLFSGLMPGSALEVLVLPATGQGISQSVHRQEPGASLPTTALAAVGKALDLELAATQSDMAQTALDGGCEVFAFRPDVRLQILSATGLTLVEAESEVA